MGEAPGHSVEPIKLACAAMGTRFELVIWPEHAGRRASLLAAGEDALEEVRIWHQRLSAFEPSSFLSHLNRNAHAGPVVCDPEVFALLRLCREVYQQSGGAFDPSVGPLMRAAGFRGESREEVGGAIAEACAAVGFDRIELDEARLAVRFGRAGILLDLGAVAKGWALDQAAARLRESGVKSALLHGGTSSVVAIGAPCGGACEFPCGRAWEVGLAGAGGEGGAGAEGVPRARLRDWALGVSAPHGRVVADAAGVEHGHVLDPRSGRSASEVVVCAVACASAALADAWSTAILVEPGLAWSPKLRAGMEVALARRGADGGVAWELSGAGRVLVVPSSP